MPTRSRFSQDNLRVLHAEACALAAFAFGVSMDELVKTYRGNSRSEPLFARRVAIYLMRLNEAPHKAIAELFGTRSISQIYRALIVVEDARDDPAIDAELDALEITLRRRLRAMGLHPRPKGEKLWAGSSALSRRSTIA